MAGGPLYDLSFSAPGPNGLFDYPPTFILAVLPFAASLSPSAAIARLDRDAPPRVRRRGRDPAGPARDTMGRPPARGAVLALPLRGEAGPAGAAPVPRSTRSRGDGPTVRRAAGISAALGTAAKLQPVLLFGWALATRRYPTPLPWPWGPRGGRALASVVAGPGAWPDWIALISRVGEQRSDRTAGPECWGHRLPGRGSAADRHRRPVGERGGGRSGSAARVAPLPAPDRDRGHGRGLGHGLADRLAALCRDRPAAGRPAAGAPAVVGGGAAARTWLSAEATYQVVLWLALLAPIALSAPALSGPADTRSATVVR